MGKMIIFLPLIIFFGFFACLVAGFLLLVFKLVKKSRDSAWEGQVVDKLYNQARDRDNYKKINQFYSLVFRTTTGQTIKTAVSKKMYDEYNIGDKARKAKGTLWPEKI